MPLGVVSPQQRPPLPHQQQLQQQQQQQQQNQQSLNFQQQQQQIQQYFFQQQQQLQQLQLQLQAQENNPQQNQPRLPYTAQQIAMARQSLLAQQQQQLALLAQQYQQQQQLQQQSQAQSLSQSMQSDIAPNADSVALHNAAIATSMSASAAMSPAHTVTSLASSVVPTAAPISANVLDDGKGRAGAGINGITGASSPAPNSQQIDPATLAMFRATAAKFGIPESALSRLPPNQLQLFLNSLQAQHTQQQQQQQQQHGSQSQTPVSSASGVLSPQRQVSDSALPTGISGSNGNGTPTKSGGDTPRPKSARSKKGVARDRSISRSPAPTQNQNQNQNHGTPQLFIPTALHIPQQSSSVLGSPMGFANSPRSMGNQSAVQRKGSMASITADDARGTPTPSESSVGGPAGSQTQQVTYTAEEIANAHKKSEEFLKRLPEFTSESFVEFLQKFLKDNNISGNFSKPPVFADRQIDLYRFFCEVVGQGGLEQVHVRRVWRQVAKDSGLPDIPTLPPLLSRWYKVWLQPLEQLAVYPPGHPKHTGINANFSLKKRRKPDTFGSPGSTPGPVDRPYSVNPESSKRPKMYSPITNGAASATASPAPFTPPPPLPISSSAMHLPTGPMGFSSVQSTSAPSLPTNGFTPTPLRSLPPHMPVPASHTQPGAAGSASGVVANTAIASPPIPHAQPLQPQHQLQQRQNEITSPQPPSIPLITVPLPPPAPQPLRFFPLERTLDTYGGIDIQASMALRPRVLIPSASDYGSVDIRALTLSIESGIVMEVTAALNTLIQITSQPEVVVPLGQCEELAETLFSIIENIKLVTTYTAAKQESGVAPMDVDPSNRIPATSNGKSTAKYMSYSEEADLFEAMYTNDPDDGGIIGDDMQDPTSVCGLIHGSDDLWSFTSDRTLTVMYALRNMSFVPMNQQYLSTSDDFLHMFKTVLEKCDYAVQAAQGWDCDREGSEKLSEKMASLVVLRALEFRKSLMAMLVNVADRIDLQAAGKDFVDVALRLIYYFMDEKQTSDVVEEWMRESLSPVVGAAMNDPLASVLHVQAHDGRTYYLHALEAVGRMTVSDNNREFLAGSVSPDAYWPLANACISLLAGNQAAVSLNPNTVQNYTENRLMWVQMALVVFSNLVCTVTPHPLVASRRYTPFKISPSGIVGGSPYVNGMVNGIAAGSFAGGSRRAKTRHSLPFVPVVYTATAVPTALKEFRERLVNNDNVVRSLFEMVFMWWMHVGAAVNLRTNQGPLSPSAPHDSPLNDIAERAVYVLQQLHPEHDTLFTTRWSEWIVERATRIPLCPELMEVLYELTGMIPVQSVSFAKSS
ncbi:hypothetical protein EV178_005616 [Coemansia sp. RSA 1646]|nr:hypothetical protein EV178_005616 [Coemansia sp. RSA 1646]